MTKNHVMQGLQSAPVYELLERLIDATLALILPPTKLVVINIFAYCWLELYSDISIFMICLPFSPR